MARLQQRGHARIVLLPLLLREQDHPHIVLEEPALDQVGQPLALCKIEQRRAMSKLRNSLLRGHPLVFLHRITLGVLGSIKTFWWALFRRGPMTVLLGGLLIFGGVQSHAEIAYTAGISLVIVGAGLLIRWILTAAHVRQLVAGRVGFTAAALGLLVYWARPFGRMEDVLHVAGAVQLKKLTGGPEVFALTALYPLLPKLDAEGALTQPGGETAPSS